MTSFPVSTLQYLKDTPTGTSTTTSNSGTKKGTYMRGRNRGAKAQRKRYSGGPGSRRRGDKATIARLESIVSCLQEFVQGIDKPFRQFNPPFAALERPTNRIHACTTLSIEVLSLSLYRDDAQPRPSFSHLRHSLSLSPEPQPSRSDW